MRIGFADAVAALAGWDAETTAFDDPQAALAALTERDPVDGFAAVLTDGDAGGARGRSERARCARRASTRARPRRWPISMSPCCTAASSSRSGSSTDTVDTVDYAHSVTEALAAARGRGGTAVLLRPTPVAAVAAVAAAGARMPRKSTLFTPKPASGLLMRRFCDDG